MKQAVVGRFFWLHALLITTFPILADETPPPAEPTEDYYLGSLPVVLSATRLAQPQYEAPVAMTVIDRAMIDASGAVDIPELLRLVPGFQIAYASGHTLSATYHGLADEHARRMQVLIDGRPVYSPSIGGVPWTDLPIDIEDIERIEVVRGPNSTALGSNSFLGAINITTIHPSQTPRLSAKYLAGNKDFQKGFARASSSSGNFDYRLSLVKRHDDGFKKFTDDNDGVFFTIQRHDSKRVTLLNFRGDYVAPNNDEWGFQFGYNGGPRGEGIGDYEDPARTRDVLSHYQEVRWHRSLSPDNGWTVMGYHNYINNREHTTTRLSTLYDLSPVELTYFINTFFPGKSDELTAVDYSISEERFGIEAQRNQRINNRLRTVWGASARLDRVGGEVQYNRPDLIEQHLYRIFGNLEWKLRDNLTSNFGLMVERASVVGTNASPRLAVNYQPLQHHGFHVSASRAIRMPSVTETRIDEATRFQDGTLIDQITVGSTDLKPEMMDAYEIGYLGQFPEIDTTVDLKVFHNEMHDRIATVKDKAYPESEAMREPDGETSAEVYVNTGRMNINGFEASITYRPAYRTMVGFNYSYLKAKGWALNAIHRFDGRWDTEDLQDDVPTHTRSLFAMHRLPGNWDVSLLYYKVSAMKWLGEGDRLPAQDRLDARIKKTLRINGNDGHVALTYQNLLDEYSAFRHENTFDTRAYLEIGIALN